MSGDDIKPDPEKLDPAGLKDALGRTGRMLKTAGLPFEEDEFDEDDAAGGTAEFEQVEGVDAGALATGVDAGEPVEAADEPVAADEADDDSTSESSNSDDSSSSSSEDEPVADPAG